MRGLSRFYTNNNNNDNENGFYREGIVLGK